MSDEKKRIIEQTASTSIANDDWFVKDGATGGTTKIQGSKLKELMQDGIEADGVAYDNTTSGLESTDVQGAIDEVLTEGGKVQDVKVDGISVVDTNKVAQIDLTGKADVDGMYEDLFAGNLVTDEGTSDNKPYLYRQSPSGSYVDLSLVGGTVAWNQLVKPIENGKWGIRADATLNSLSDGVIAFTCTASYGGIQQIGNTGSIKKDHKYLRSVDIRVDSIPESASGKAVYWPINNMSDLSMPYNSLVEGQWKTFATIQNASNDYENRFQVLITDNRTSDFTEVKIRNVIGTDLTQDFGSTIADYIYSLEQATAGSGIAWAKSNGYLTKEYYAYNSGSLESVNVASRKIYDSNDTLLATYPLDSSITLRGIPKLDANNKLYYDGDVYNSDGTITRNYEERAYESGDESLADAITDGTNTVYKLATPTTELAQPFTNPQLVGSTEEFVDAGTSASTPTRDVDIPCGQDSFYHTDLKAKLEELAKIPDVPSTNGTYTLKATRSASGVTYSWVSG